VWAWPAADGLPAFSADFDIAHTPNLPPAGAGDRRPRKTSDKLSKVSPKGYAKAAAKKVGKTSRTVARDVSRGEKIDPQALADLAGSCLDNGTELDALAKLPAAEQRSLAEAAKRGETVSAITAHSACDPEHHPKPSDGTEEIELGKLIARLRRAQARNTDTMCVCDALERRLKRP